MKSLSNVPSVAGSIQGFNGMSVFFEGFVSISIAFFSCCDYLCILRLGDGISRRQILHLG